MFEVGDTVRVYNDKGQDSGVVSKIVKIGQNISGKTLYWLEEGYPYPERWLRLVKENDMFKVNDLVKYINGESIYKIESVKDDSIKIRHLVSNKVYNETVSCRLVKLDFKIGDKVKLVTGKSKDTITTITGAFVSSLSKEISYTVEKDGQYIGYSKGSLELVTEEPPKFKKGDLVYVDSTKIVSSQCYEVLQVLEVKNENVICSNSSLKRYSFNEKTLLKFKFQPNDTVQVTNLYNVNYKRIDIVSKIRFSDLNKNIEYCLRYSDLWYKESELNILSKYTIDAKTAENIAIKATDIDVTAVDCKVSTCKNIYDSLEEKVSEIVDAYINNNNLNQSKNDENRLQEERTLELGRDEQERVGIHGRRHQVAVRECYQRYEAGFGKIKKHSIRVKNQLSTSYSRTHGSKD